ncbi:hypothetical protein J7443_10210 [Tropicibacter sp. R15_0]|uniref:hypothetical protein n=1 Tax=Tropicibacter sp. R15_0 TaxID=2821101 RepID=UPI001ADC787F|nr:hypothetical protein [Tropicibacter sp. R15_0]MBO9465600.1 hypothetical protein [Tropicibacter sp. R15_0]
MYRNFVALACAGVLSACAAIGSDGDNSDNPLVGGTGSGIGSGSQPLVADPTETVDDSTPVTGTDTDPDQAFGHEHDANLRMNAVNFDSTTGELVLNNLPFDGDDNLYQRDGAASVSIQGTSGTGFDAYRNASGTADYYAVFRLSDSGFSQVTAAATDRYVSFGFGGVAAQRLSGSGALPEADQSYIFTGEYAAVRTVTNTGAGVSVQYVTGVATLDVDIEDFDDIGAVEGIIASRQFFDENGVHIADLDGADFISLATSQINFDDWTIQSSTATAYVNGEAGATGNWEGMFAGPNGEEVAGIVIVEGDGPVGIDPDTGAYVEVSVRETGGFVATR